MEDESPKSTLMIANTFEEEFKFYERVDVRSLIFTYIDFYKDRIYISGLSDADLLTPESTSLIYVI